MQRSRTDLVMGHGGKKGGGDLTDSEGGTRGVARAVTSEKAKSYKKEGRGCRMHQTGQYLGMQEKKWREVVATAMWTYITY